MRDGMSHPTTNQNSRRLVRVGARPDWYVPRLKAIAAARAPVQANPRGGITPPGPKPQSASLRGNRDMVTITYNLSKRGAYAIERQRS